MFGSEALAILLIDDRRDTSSPVSSPLSTLSEAWARLVCVGDVDAALHSLATAPADAILLSFGLDDAALTALEQLKPSISSAPAIVLGTTDNPAVAARAIERGAADYLAHGHFDGPLLERSVRYAVTRRRLQNRIDLTNEILQRRERELLAAVDDLKLSHEALEATQLQLLQMEKMESVGRLAAGIAHEVKNPLAIISTGIEFIRQSIQPDGTDPVGRVLESMSRAVRRADTVIRGLLDFSAPAALRAEPCDLNGIIHQALLLVEHELMRCKVSLRAELAEPLPMVSVDANKVEQVFLNLFMNAIQAMPDGGTLILRTRFEQLATLGHSIGDHRAERFRAGDVVVVAEVDDSGHGILDDNLPKVFDPFFTTKPTGKGTGLGLSVARTIIELHGGMLQLSNRPGGGARALVVLKATGDSPHDNDDRNAKSEDPGVDRGRRSGLHAHDGHDAEANRPV